MNNNNGSQLSGDELKKFNILSWIVTLYPILSFMFAVLKIPLMLITVVMIVVWVIDMMNLTKLGVTGAWKIWGLFITPIYMMFRDKRTEHLLPSTERKFAAIAWVVFVLSIVVSFGYTLHQISTAVVSYAQSGTVSDLLQSAQ